MNKSAKHVRYFATEKGRASRRRGRLAQTVKERAARIQRLKEQIR